MCLYVSLFTHLCHLSQSLSLDTFLSAPQRNSHFAAKACPCIASFRVYFLSIPSPVAASVQGPVEVVCLSQSCRLRTNSLIVKLVLARDRKPRPSLDFLKLATIAKARGSVRGGRARGSKASASRSRKAAASLKRAARKLKRQERGWRPKRALSPYMFFCKDQHANVTADNPNIPFTEVGRILGAQWQQMTEKDKKPYTKKAEADKKRYLKDLKRCKNK